MVPNVQRCADALSAHFGEIGGGVVVCVRDGELLEYSAFGCADSSTGRRFTEHSVFDIASCSKAFTTMLVSILCDEGKMNWDAPVRTYIPEFHLGDEYVSAHMTLRDMACHRSGLASHNLMRRLRYEDVHTCEEYAKRIMNLPLSDGFRNTFHYQNELYLLLGIATERVTGEIWENLITERIAEPLGMRLYFRGSEKFGRPHFLPEDDPDIAMPHLEDHGAWEVTFHDPFALNNPCGGIRTDLASMRRWVEMLASGGMLPDGRRLVSEKEFRRMMTPMIYWSSPMKPDRMRCYGLGWAPSVYRGEDAVYHGGSLRGFRSAVGYLPERHAAVFTSVNVGPDATRATYLKYALYDLAMGLLDVDYSADMDALTARQAQAEKNRKKDPAPIPTTRVEAERFVGHWWSDAYGDLEISANVDGSLHLSYGRDRGDLPCTGERKYQGRMEECGAELCDLRFSEDGQNAVLSICEVYTPVPFRKVQ